jgi:hypothetical protein
MTSQTAPARSLHDEIVAELSSFAQRLRPTMKLDSAERIFLDGLLRDAYILERSAKQHVDQEDSQWMQPYLAIIADKMKLAKRLLGNEQEVVDSYSDRIAALHSRNEVMVFLRCQFLPIIDQYQFHEELKNRYDFTALQTLLSSPRFLSSDSSEIAPEWRLASRVLEIVNLQRALEWAESSAAAESQQLAEVAEQLERLLTPALSTLSSPELGSMAEHSCIAVRGQKRDFNIPKGQVARSFCPAFHWRGHYLCHAVVSVSAGLELQLIATIESVLKKLSKQRQSDTRVSLAPALEFLYHTIENNSSSAADKARACLEAVTLLLPVVDDSEDQSRLIAVLQSDFRAHDCQWILASPGAIMDEGRHWDGRDVYSYDVAPGQVVRLIRPGLRLADELISPALVQVSQGKPAAGVLDELFEYLPDDDDRGAHLKQKLQRARLLSAGDNGAQLSRELAELALFLKDDYLCDAARLAMRMVIDNPPLSLSAIPGWEALHEFLLDQFDALVDDGESGENAVFRLTRPYLQGLRSHQFHGAEMRSLGESLGPLLSLYDEALSSAARQWLYSRLERLTDQSIATGGHTRRLLRVAARALSQFHKDDNETALIELTNALNRSGIKVFPDLPSQLLHCFAPKACFHVFDARYDSRARRAVLDKEFNPCLTLGQEASALSADNTETGAITLSLGPEPALIEWLCQDSVRQSRMGSACHALCQRVTALDKERLIAELAGQADGERSFVKALAAAIITSLEDCKWQRSAADRAVFQPLFEILREDYHLTLFPGYWTYREMKAVEKTLGAEQIDIQLSQDGPRGVDILSHGALYRERLLRPLKLHWTVGEAPAYVSWLRDQIPWFDAILSGSEAELGLEVSSAARAAILDFESPDASGIDAVIHSLETILEWLQACYPQCLSALFKALKTAPGLELEVFPRPGQCYSRERLLSIIERADASAQLEIVKDPSRRDGEAVVVSRMSLFQDNKLLSQAPAGRFAFKTLPSSQLQLTGLVEPILDSANVLPAVKTQLKNVLASMALTDEARHSTLQLKAFKVLWKAHLYDPNFPTETKQTLHKASLVLAQSLSKAGLLLIERFDNISDFATVEQQFSADQVSIDDAFTLPGRPEIVEVRQPYLSLEEQTIQRASLLRGRPTSDEVLLEYDQVLRNALLRLKTWRDGAKALIESLFDDKQQQIISRTLKRIEDTRARMFKAAKAGKKALPAKTSRRDAIRFLIDQVHRLNDALAIQSEKSLRRQFEEQLFRDVVYRSAGPYLSKEYGISIDMSVVAGADTQALVGRYKKESSGPKPLREHRRIYSVVVPCYKQDGVTIRPATVRLGDF